MARILVVDDDRQLIEVLSIALGDAGHEVKTAYDGLEALDAVKSFRPALVVADVNMPRLDGFQMCKRLRDAGDATPVVLLTSRDGEIDETLGLELGADDYVTKPFAMRVLVARIAAILRRDAIRAGKERGAAATSIDELSIDADRVEAKWKGAIIPLTLTEFRVLEALARRKGLVLTRDKLLELVRGDDSVVGERLVDVYVRRLRRKLEAIDPAFSRIETVVGMGYRWKDA
jgi:DNA-binding response OmpR family regulator